MATLVLTRPRRLAAALVTATRAATRRLGRRGAALGWFSTLDVVVAQSLIDPASRAVLRNAPAYRIIVHVDLRIWAALWFLVGALCMVQAWQASDRWAFSAQIGLLWVWAALTFAAAGPLAPRALIGGVVWATFGGFVMVLAGWPEPPPPLEPPPRVELPPRAEA